MNWFVGAHDHQVDDKGRVVLPAPFRDHFGPGTVVWVRDIDHVELFNAEAWEDFADRVTEHRAQGRITTRQAAEVFMNAVEVRIDNAGRFVIPERLRDKAQLGRDVQVCGLGKSVVIKNRPAETADEPGVLTSTAGRLDELGL